MQDDFAQSFFDPVGKFAHRRARRRTVSVEHDRLDRQRFAKVKQCRTTKGGFLGVVQSDRHDPQIDRFSGRDCAQRHASHAGLERFQTRLVVRNTFGANPDRAAAGQQPAGGGKCLQVARHVLALILATVCRQRVERAHKIADHRNAKQRRFGDERNAPRRQAQQKNRRLQPFHVGGERH